MSLLRDLLGGSGASAPPSAAAVSLSRSSASFQATNDRHDYEMVQLIGIKASGAHSVYLCKFKPTQALVAVKKVSLEHVEYSAWEAEMEELRRLRWLKHPNIISVSHTFISRHELYVVSPFFSGGSCGTLLQHTFKSGLSEPLIAYLLRETLRALAYIHSNWFIHRDVKASNIMFDSTGAVALRDLSHAVSMLRDGKRQYIAYQFAGSSPESVPWTAPEVLEQNLLGYDNKADIYSLGITALELATGQAPYYGLPPTKILLLKLLGPSPRLEDMILDSHMRFSKSFRTFIDLCLNPDPNERPSALKLLDHPFFKQRIKRDSAWSATLAASSEDLRIFDDESARSSAMLDDQDNGQDNGQYNGQDNGQPANYAGDDSMLDAADSVATLQPTFSAAQVHDLNAPELKESECL
ncbi:serine/threonine-protein kinase ppk11 [Capsaspora owczarzaki ATCC 30864]|uniref:serine/threonine-protein kinase ppk11 n=1 Tax=Capsaspora owczarzaki (strain ATCC 30864) TaxID=595528 RepID=UPI00035256FC|nr:serine/threonine-protein kinase ppk11 [Capsaspora owczarzaki ATCC 30864]|eukprot:XP_004365717.2 serine/threonine-protein kinase ppk11 [Capsaspora owczarzaki ATCC 30864]